MHVVCLSLRDFLRVGRNWVASHNEKGSKYKPFCFTSSCVYHDMYKNMPVYNARNKIEEIDKPKQQVSKMPPMPIDRVH